MMRAFFKKEIDDFFRSKTVILFTILFSAVISYSFYSAVSLYSKASVAAIGNPLYAAGFEPVPGIFVPTFGGLFIILTLIAPFLFIQSISNEKRYNTITLISQFPMSLRSIFGIKFLSAVVFLLIIIACLFPVFIIWYLIGGHLAFGEILLLIFGYILYGMFIITISFLAASLFSNNAQSSMMALFLIIFSWFLDFGKDMNIIPFMNKISQWSVTGQLKYFENGILSVKTVVYLVLLIAFIAYLAYLFFNFGIKNRVKPILISSIVFLFALWLNSKINCNFDLTESGRNSFPYEYTEFLKKVPAIKIDIYLRQTDSRARDYANDFLKKLRLVKSNVMVHYVTGKELDKNYGIFKYTIGGKSETTYSNSEEEIFMILETLSGIKIDKKNDSNSFKGYPLVAKSGWSVYMFIFYLIILPVGILMLYLKNQIIYTRRA